MQFKLTIELGDEAMQTDMDDNGNTVGRWEASDGADEVLNYELADSKGRPEQTHPGEPSWRA